MALNVKDLCRVCATKNEFSKDLLDASNKNIMDLIQQYTQIVIHESDSLSTRICLDCEERFVTFQLFILECSKAQEYMRQMLKGSYDVKLEDKLYTYGSPVIKSEFSDTVKNERTEDLEDVDEDEQDYIENDIQITDDNDSDGSEDLTIASLKNRKKKDNVLVEEDTELGEFLAVPLKDRKQKSINKVKEITEQDATELNEILSKPHLKMSDLVKFTCPICYTSFQSWLTLSMHHYKTHKKKVVLYCKCGFMIRSKSILYKHMSQHKKESRSIRKEMYPNSVKKPFNVKDYIDFICTICGEQRASWYDLKAHCEKIHKTVTSVKCICGLVMKSKSCMYKHVQDHNNPTELSCNQCSKVLKSMEALNKHKLKHVPKSERKFVCPTCDKVCNSQDLLRSHMKTHVPIEERKIYNCEYCHMKFTSQSSAKSHKRIVHDKIKSYVCDLCGYACATNGELRQHRAIHSDDKPFVCSTCNKPFKTYANLKTHMDIHDQTSYACYVCGRVLNSRRTLRKHLLVHEEKCRHVCSYCNKAFKRRQTLKVHLYTHTGDKPLSCKWCDERFSYASTLRSHRLRCHPDKMAAAGPTHSAHATHATQPHHNYTFNHIVSAQENYIKNDLAAMNVAKNEVEMEAL